MKTLGIAVAVCLLVSCGGNARQGATLAATQKVFKCQDKEKYWRDFDWLIAKASYTTGRSDLAAMKTAQVKAFNDVVHTLQNTGERDPHNLDQFLFGTVSEQGQTYQFVGWTTDFRYHEDTPDSQVVFFAYDTTQPVGFYFSDTDRPEHQCYGQEKLAAELLQYGSGNPK